MLAELRPSADPITARRHGAPLAVLELLATDLDVSVLPES
jgi:hypothetical protein